MIKEFFESFKDNLKLKTTNPFLGSLIIVWIFHNWDFWVTLFNLNSFKTINEKLGALRPYLDSYAFVPNMFVCILITILVIIVTYLLLNLSRLIVNFYEKKITPFVYKITDKSSIVTTDVYLKLKADYDKLQNKYETERENRIKIQAERDEIELKFGKKLVDDDISIVIAKDIKDKGYSDVFSDLLAGIPKKQGFIESPEIDYISVRGLIEYNGNNRNGTVYKLTELGEKVRNEFNKMQN